MLHLQLLSRPAPFGQVGPSFPYPYRIVDISKTEIFNSYFGLALEDWSEPLGDLVALCGTTRLRPSSSGNLNYIPLIKWLNRLQVWMPGCLLLKATLCVASGKELRLVITFLSKEIC